MENKLGRRVSLYISKLELEKILLEDKLEEVINSPSMSVDEYNNTLDELLLQIENQDLKLNRLLKYLNDDEVIEIVEPDPSKNTDNDK